jgi:hypothetical protein
MARTCAARSAVQSRAPRHHSEIIHIDYRGMSTDHPGERWACSAGTARTCAARSAAQSRAPRHHSEIIQIDGCPGTIQERNGRV